VKCIRCGTDSKYKDRGGGRCPSCHKPFAFEPQKGDPLTDAAFEAAIDAVSAKGRLRWGVEHLYYEVCRRRARASRFTGCLSVLAFFPGAFLGYLLMANLPLGLPAPLRLVIVVCIGLLAGFLVRRALARRRGTTVAVTLDQFNKMWGRWKSVHGAPKGVIARKGETPARRPAEPDLADYSFDRAVICDRARTADLLIANNFHFENNCAVLAIGGYPAGPFETIRVMLRRNPRLQAFALHDATAPGCRLARQLATSPEWFQNMGPVTDVGLRPSHAGPFKGLYLPNPGGAVAAGDGITATEAEWLSRHALELAAIRPEQVIKRLFRAINRTPADDDGADEAEGTSGGSGSVQQDTESFSADAGDSDGGGDAFG
jgi:hypothetical protein